jgi:hypothetical protein
MANAEASAPLARSQAIVKERKKRIFSHRVRREHREKEVNLSVKN